METPIIDSASALRSTILNSSTDLPIEKVDCRPYWDCDVWVRTLPVGERDRFEDDTLIRKQKNKSREANLVDLRSRLVQATACDESGRLIFAPSDIPALAKRGSVPMDRLFETAQRLCRMTESDVEDMVKN